LTAELKCPPLLSHYATLSEWQFGLDKLLNYSKILKKPTSKISRARIVYLVDIDTFDIQPYRRSGGHLSSAVNFVTSGSFGLSASRAC